MKIVFRIVHIVMSPLKVPIPKQRIHLKEDKFLTSQAPSKAAPVYPTYTSGPKLPHCIPYTSGPKFPTEFKAGQQVNYQCIIQLLLTLLQVSNFSPRY